MGPPNGFLGAPQGPRDQRGRDFCRLCCPPNERGYRNSRRFAVAVSCGVQAAQTCCFEAIDCKGTALPCLLGCTDALSPPSLWLLLLLLLLLHLLLLLLLQNSLIAPAAAAAAASDPRSGAPRRLGGPRYPCGARHSAPLPHRSGGLFCGCCRGPYQQQLLLLRLCVSYCCLGAPQHLPCHHADLTSSCCCRAAAATLQQHRLPLPLLQRVVSLRMHTRHCPLGLQQQQRHNPHQQKRKQPLAQQQQQQQLLGSLWGPRSCCMCGY